MTRYIILGAGAIGGAIGGRLAHAGSDAALVARGDHLAALQTNGLRLRTPTEDLRIPVTAVGAAAELELTADDVLVVATKTHQAGDALASWADAPVRSEGRESTAGELLPVLMALNGVASEGIALRYFARVFGVCVWMPAVHLVPGEVIVRGAPTSGMFHLGRYPAALTDQADRRLLTRIEQDWTAANFDIRLPTDVMPWKYRKLISNIGNAFQALVGPGGGVRPLVRAAEAEARDVLSRAGIDCTSDAEETQARAAGFTMRPVPGVPDDVGGSTWQSLTRGTGNVETDYLNGEIALLARLHGLAAPINATMASLARVAAATGQRPGVLSAADLARRLGLE
ncbi:MAG TPA: 2-dehydropantoate 2-reductase N-terminal domain-containing protein [Propionibacteriaceae bacterium]|nr:2-dehydropantoate 2-reductase N-terminal domain-containing protein [Propionibacteriaceae bacterium]